MSQPPKRGSGGVSEVEKREAASHKRREREENNRNPSVIRAIYSIASQLKANGDEDQSSDNARRRREIITIGFLFLTFAATGVGDFIFYRTMMDTRTAQRPIIALAHVDEKIEWVAGHTIDAHNGRIFWTWHFTNVGHGLAVNVRFSPSLSIMGSFRKTADYIPQSFSGTLAEGEDRFITSVSLEELSEDDYKAQILPVNGGATLRARFTYQDVYGASYETDICQSRLATGALMECAGNQIK